MDNRIYTDEVQLFHDRRWSTVIYYVQHKDGRELFSAYTAAECEKWMSECTFVREVA